jgi:signal transduction histidine kinase
MRFDDRLETVLAINTSLASGREAMWRQLVDMLAHSGQFLSAAGARHGLAALALLRSGISVPVRARSAHSIASRCRYAPLATFLANDDPAVAVALFDHIPLDGPDWDSIIPNIGPLARSRLRLRANKPAIVSRMLDSFGSTDFSLPDFAPAHAPAAAAPDDALPPTMSAFRPAGSSIADLVQRIEAYRNRTAINSAGLSANAPMPQASADDDGPIARFSSDLEGVIRSISDLPRGAFVGLSLAIAARPVDTGVDAGVARAFAGRQDIVNGRLLLVDAGPWSGQWLINATPRFDRQNGRFVGYDGTIGHNDVEGASTGEPPVNDNAPQPSRSDGMQQMVHELRSPLNAISGFAQLIEGQFFGPVGQHYRDIARTIIDDAHYLATAFDDIDIAARLDSGAHARIDGQSDIAAMMAAMADAAQSDDLAGLAYDGPASSVHVAIDERELHQLLARFLGLVRARADSKAPTIVSLVSNAATRRVLVLASGEGVDGDEQRGDTATVGALGAGFSWRLIDRMARTHGGTIEVMRGKALLNLPYAIMHDERVGAEGF